MMTEFLAQVPLANLIVLCCFGAGIIISVFILILRKIKGINLKVGNNSFSLNNEQQREAVIKIVTDYADFKYRLREENYEGMSDFKTQARRFANLQIDQSLQRLTTEYFVSIKPYEESNLQAYRITTGVFTLFSEALKSRMLKFAMDVFEQNHLKDKLPNDLISLAQVHYTRLEDIFKEYTRLNWLSEMLPYETLEEILKKLRPFNEKLVLSVLDMFSNLSKQKFELINFVNEIDTVVRTKVQKTGVLPTNSLTLVSNLYICGIGINKESINNWLEEIEKEDK